MKPLTLSIIRDEHAALAAILRTLTGLIDQYQREGSEPDFQALRAMLFYVDEFPERLHHAQESLLLFPRLRQRCSDAQTVLDRLEREHAQGERAIRELEHALLAFEMMGASRREAFETAARRYADFYFQHMEIEEKEVLPLAERHLTPGDWAELDDAFGGHRDPLAGHEPAAEYRELFRRIVHLVPAPLGLG